MGQLLNLLSPDWTKNKPMKNINPENWKVRLISITFGLEHYELPKTLCGLHIRLAISLLLLPFTWMGVLINYLLKDNEKTIPMGIGLFIVGLVGMIICCSPGTGNIQTHSFFNPASPGILYGVFQSLNGIERILLLYCGIPVIILAIAASFCLFALVLVMICYPCSWAYENIKDRWEDRDEWFTNPNTKMFWIVQILRSIKKKYCVQIKYQ